MQQGYLCPNCGRTVRYVPEYQTWYCDFCRYYPFSQQMPMPYHMPKKDDTSKTIFLVVIIVVVVIIVPIIIAAVIYVMISGMMSSSMMVPVGVITFSESPTDEGVYTGSFASLSRTVDLDDVSMTIIDSSIGNSDNLNPIYDEGTARIPNGMSCTFSDMNNNDMLDTSDIFKIENGAAGDMIRVIYDETGDLIDSYTLR